jgi:Spy/CpxP family protein refolding chaperone
MCINGSVAAVMNNKESIMRTNRKVLLAAVAAAVFAASAGVYAQPGPGYYGGGPGMMGGGPGMMGGPAFMGPRGGYGPGPGAGSAGPRGGFGPGANVGVNQDARLAYLKNELKISSAQESAWNTYAAAMKQQAESMQAMRDQMFAAAQSGGPERFTQRAELMKQRAAGAETMAAAIKDLYAALTPEQKSLADLHFGGARFAQGPRGPGRWR